MKNKKFHYAWVMGVLGFLILYVTIGMAMTVYGSYSPFFLKEYGLNHTQNGTLVSLRTTVAFCAMFLCGVYYRKLSLRVGLTIGIIVGGIGYIVLAIGSSYAAAATAFVLIGFAHGIAGMIPVSNLIKNWFIKYRGLFLGVTAAASGFATFTLPTTVTAVVQSNGLRTCLWGMAAIWIVFALLVLTLCRDTPETKGLQPLGYAEGAEIKEGKEFSRKLHPYKATRGDFILLLIAAFLLGGTHNVSNAFSTLNLTTVGYDPADVAKIISAFGLMLIFGKLILGAVSDRFAQHKVLWIWMIATMVANGLLACSGMSWFNLRFAFLANAIWAIGAPLTTTGFGIMALDMEYKDNFSDIVRLCTCVFNIGSATFQSVCGMLADASGGYYHTSYAFISALCIPTMILLYIAYARAHKRYKNQTTEDSAEIAD